MNLVKAKFDLDSMPDEDGNYLEMGFYDSLEEETI